MSEQKPNYLLPIVGAAVVAAGGAGAYFYFNQPGNIAPVGVTRLAIAKVVPKQALMMAHFTPTPAAMAQLDQFQSPETKKIVEEGWKSFQKEAFKNTGINYELDVKPWSGDIAIALIPSVPAAKASAETFLPVKYLSQATPEIKPEKAGKSKPDAKFDALVVFSIKDKVGADKFAAKVQTQAKAKSNGKNSQSEYKGIQILQSNFGNGSNLNSAPIGEYLVFASETNTLKNAIDTFNGGASIEPDLNPNQLQLKNSLIQIYVPDFAGAVERGIAAAGNPGSVTPTSIESLKRLKSMAFGIGVEEDGLRMKGIAEYDPKTYDIKLKTSENKILARFPSETFALVTGTDIKGRWDAILKDLEKEAETKKALTDIRKSLKESPVALDLDKDIFGWMDGEFGFGMVASDKGILAQVGASPVLMIQSSNRAAADATLKKIMDYGKTVGMKFNTRTVNGVEVTEWVQGVAILAHGWNQDTLFITAEPLSDAVSGKPASSVDGSTSFKTLTSALNMPSSNLGTFYFDIAKSWEIYNRIAPAEVKASFPAESKALIESMRGLVGSAVMTNQFTNRFEVLLALKPKATK
jgi:Protein of unknown function (DUF3352)